MNEDRVFPRGIVQAAASAERLPFAKLVVVEQVYYSSSEDTDPEAVDCKFVRLIRSPEGPSSQPLRRRIDVGPTWQPLDVAWLEEAGHFILVNNEGRRLQLQPTEMERYEIGSRIVEIGLVLPGSSPSDPTPFAEVPAGGESCRLTPVNLPLFRVRCRNGKARCHLYLFPR
jgi:hypothetical protein